MKTPFGLPAITGVVVLCAMLFSFNSTAQAGDFLQEQFRIGHNVYRETSPELVVAAEDHANWLASHGYEGFNGNGHDFGHGNSQRRAAAHGFMGSLLAPNPGHANFIVGECIACGQNSPAEVIADWLTSTAGHGKVVTAPSFDVCGFGHATSRSGRHIWVGMFGKRLPVFHSQFEVAFAPPLTVMPMPMVVANHPAVVHAPQRHARRGVLRLFGGCR